MTTQDLSLGLAINGRENQLHSRLTAFGDPAGVAQAADQASEAAAVGVVAVVGMGYVGLPTALALASRGVEVLGVDVDTERLRSIVTATADLCAEDRQRLGITLADGTLKLTSDSAAVSAADVVIICVPTPVDGERVPELSALQRASAEVVANARPGQTIILTSTSFVGTTRKLLADPLRQRGLAVGADVYVAFSPERIDPGNPDHVQRDTPRVVGGVSHECTQRAARVIHVMAESVYLVSSPEAAELTKLYENVFRAVTLALANEFADVCGILDLDPIEVTLAASTKPYGFLGAFPGPGVGGHCIPCDPHYLLWQLPQDQAQAPLISQAMRSIDARPATVVRRAGEVLAESSRPLAGARVLVVGVSYKAGVSDLRESPALPIIAGLLAAGADVHYHDPLIPSIVLPDGTRLDSELRPRGTEWELALIHTVHPGVDYAWAHDCPQVLDATYQFDGGLRRAVV
jgi:nucleotide sugar dehydrogenase